MKNADKPSARSQAERGRDTGPKPPHRPPPRDVAFLDPLIHEAGRLRIMAALRGGEFHPFSHLVRQTGLTRGNFASHVARLIEAGYVRQKKRLHLGQVKTEYQLTAPGRAAFRGYCRAWRSLCEPRRRPSQNDRNESA